MPQVATENKLILRERDPCDGVGIVRVPPKEIDPEAGDAQSMSHRLFAILSWKRPFDSSAEELFARRYIDVHPLASKDAFGNRHLHIPYADGSQCKVMWSCHIDTCHHDEGYQRLSMLKDDEDIMFIQTRRGEGNCLGADDGTGVWLMLEMIAKGKPGYYLFHRGEEKGCLGSRWIKDNKPDLLKKFDAAIALDRRDFDNIITHQGGERGCSEEFALAIGKQITGYKPDPTGAYTDTKQYFEHIPECTNLSVGYQGQHGPLEKQYVMFAMQLRSYLLAMDLKALPIKRDPKVKEYKVAYGGGQNYPRYDYMKDPEKKSRWSVSHDARQGAKHDYKYDRCHKWSHEENRDLHEDDYVWVEGRGYVLKTKRILPLKPDASLLEDKSKIVPDEEADEEFISEEKWALMLEDSNTPLYDLVKKYPHQAAGLLLKAKYDRDAFCMAVHGEEDFIEFLSDLEEEDEAEIAALRGMLNLNGDASE